MRKIIKKFLGAELFKTLSFSQFLYFLFSVVFSQIAVNMMNIVIIFLVFHLTNSNFFVSIIVLISIVPQIFLSFPGGMLADIKNKKNILFYGNILRALAIYLLFLNPKSLALIILVTFFISIITQFYVPSEIPLIPHIVEEKYLDSANSLFGIALFGSILVGYILAGPAIRIFSVSGVFLFLAIAFLAASFFIGFIEDKIMETKKEVSSSFYQLFFGMNKFIKDEFKKTCQFMFGKKNISGAFFMLTFSQILILILATLVPGYTKTILHITSEKVSYILFSPAALGMFIGALLTNRISKRFEKEEMITLGVFLAGFVFMLFPYMSRIEINREVGFVNLLLPYFLDITMLHLTIFLSAVLGFSYSLIFVSSQTIIQKNVPKIFISKVYGLLFGLVGALSLFPVLLTGGVADIIGIGRVMLGIGFIIIIVGTIRLLFYFF